MLGQQISLVYHRQTEWEGETDKSVRERKYTVEHWAWGYQDKLHLFAKGACMNTSLLWKAHTLTYRHSLLIF